jgi:TonB-linked SusC/RagA family outer membrane protein
MRKFVTKFTVLLFLFVPFYSLAQTIISGKVMNDKSNTPVPDASITIKGKGNGTKSDANGSFTITAAKGDVLIISSVGFLPQQTKVANFSSLLIHLKPTDGTMDEVVVTAMDIKRKPRELGYSVQTVKGTEIQETQRENFINSLEGRVSGLSVTPTTGAAGASSGIILRGFNTISGTNQPLFILDGIILDNSTLNSNSQGGSGIGLASDLPNRNNDYTNRISDINPNDIESVTVLKGPEATALYGSQASNGAIVITTKKAKSTNKKILISYDNNFRFQKITRFAETNNDYGPGTSNGIPFNSTTATGAFTSYGPAWPAGTKLYDNLHNFYRTGFSQTHNLGLEFGLKNVGFRASGQYFDDMGVVPNNTYNKYNFKISNNTRIGKYVNLTASFAYTHTTNVKPLKGTTANGGYLLDLYSWPANNDIRNYQDATGGKLLLFNANYNSDYDNPLWSAKNNYSADKTNRYVYTLGIDITPFKWLTVAGRFGYDTYKTDGFLFQHPQSFILTAATLGTLDNYYRTYKGYNHTITATAKKKFGAFTTSLMVGTMWQDFETDQYSVVGNHVLDSIRNGVFYKGGAVVTGFNPWDSSSTLASSRTRLLRNVKGLPNLSILRELAYFGEVSIGYKNVAFFTYSHRFESASPIPKDNRNYNFPGASLSLILSDIFPMIKTGNIINYAKFRASLANTARLNDPYSNQRVFVNNQSSSTNPGNIFTYGFTNANPLLRPERQQTYEIGGEFRLFNNAITIEAAYYNTLCTDQIAQGYRASYATGAVLNTTNAASLRNEGFELTLGLVPIRKKNFDWNVSFNLNHMWSKVLTLPESIGLLNDFYNSDTYISNVRGGLIRGHSTGTITGSVYQRNNNGQILINPATGIPLTTGATNSLIADRTPAFTLGTTNSFRYKNWSLNFLWDLKVGGDIYNGTEQQLTNLGKSQRTANRSVPILVPGVLNDGQQNTSKPTDNTIMITPYFLSTYYTSLPDEEFIQKDVNWLRLRDITLNYKFTPKFLHHLKVVKSLSLFVTGNDLILFTNYHGADASVNSNNPGTGGIGGYGLDLGSTPTPKSYSFGLRANF